MNTSKNVYLCVDTNPNWTAERKWIYKSTKKLPSVVIRNLDGRNCLDSGNKKLISEQKIVTELFSKSKDIIFYFNIQYLIIVHIRDMNGSIIRVS